MLEINLQLFSGGGARSGLGGGGGDRDAKNSDAKTYRFWYKDTEGNVRFIDQRGENIEDAKELAKMRLKQKGIHGKFLKKVEELSKKESNTASNVTNTETSVKDNKSKSSIDLSDSPLSYTSPLQKMNSEHLENIKNKAKEIMNKTKENLAVYDKNGNKIYEKEGEINKVGAPSSVMQQADHDIHNHGRGAGILGGTFSVVDSKGGGDIQGLVKYDNLKTSFASTKEGVYFISKTDDFKGTRFLTHMKSVETKIMGEMSKKMKELDNMRKSGKITYDQYKARYRRINNNALVSMHNEYLKNQSRYGYVYGLFKQKD